MMSLLPCSKTDTADSAQLSCKAGVWAQNEIIYSIHYHGNHMQLHTHSNNIWSGVSQIHTQLMCFPNCTLMLVFNSKPSYFRLWSEESWLAHLTPLSLITLHSRVNASYVRIAVHEVPHHESHNVLSPRLHLRTSNRGAGAIIHMYNFYMYWVESSQEIRVYRRLYWDVQDMN